MKNVVLKKKILRKITPEALQSPECTSSKKARKNTAFNETKAIFKEFLVF
jgi:hypothetical protein